MFLGKSGPWAKSCLPPVFAIKLYWNTAKPLHFCIVYGGFGATVTELNTINRPYLLKSWKYLLFVLRQKTLPISAQKITIRNICCTLKLQGTCNVEGEKYFYSRGLQGKQRPESASKFLLEWDGVNKVQNSVRELYQLGFFPYNKV